MKPLNSYKLWSLPLIGILLLTTACAQTLKLVDQKSRHHQIYELQTSADKVHSLAFNDSFTSVVFELKGDSNLEAVFLIDKGDTIAVDRAQHGPPGKKAQKSELIILHARTDQFQVLTKQKDQNFLLHLLDAKDKGSLRKKPLQESNGTYCKRPSAVPQEDWRKGLPEPDYHPIDHEVQHGVIHHSAGNTQNADTRSVVRNIYLNHTQVNGWSDIGYNFMVGINGKIFEGRDGFGAVPDHRVKGAHFCGKNAKTIGIGLVGNYEENKPNEASLESLKHLLTWKLKKADLEAGAYHPHPPDAPDADSLGTIAGHKDGCATLCPGKHLYSQIPAIKNDVADSLAKCKTTSTMAQLKTPEKPTLSHQEGQLVLKGHFQEGCGTLAIYSLRGKTRMPPKSFRWSQHQTTLTSRIPENIASGIYVAKFQTPKGKVFNQKFLIP